MGMVLGEPFYALAAGESPLYAEYMMNKERAAQQAAHPEDFYTHEDPRRNWDSWLRTGVRAIQSGSS